MGLGLCNSSGRWLKEFETLISMFWFSRVIIIIMIISQMSYGGSAHTWIGLELGLFVPCAMLIFSISQEQKLIQQPLGVCACKG